MYQKDSSFTYCVCYDDNGVPTGAVWMTPQMRAAFKLFGNFVSIDAMKRQQNNIHWPYIAPVILDKSKTVAIVAESITTAERHKAYHFVVTSIFEMAPKRHKSEVDVIAADCFVTMSLLTSLGINDTCRLMWDHYHILKSVWPKKLGPFHFSENRPLLSRLLNAHSEQAFDEKLTELRKNLSQNGLILSHIWRTGLLIGNSMPLIP